MLETFIFGLIMCFALGVVVGRLTAPRQRPIPSDCELRDKATMRRLNLRAVAIVKLSDDIMKRMPKTTRNPDTTYGVVTHTEMLTIWDMSTQIREQL